MMQLKPVNGHLIIEPILSDGFMASQNDTYQEIGVVVAVDEAWSYDLKPFVNGRVYFDSWMAAKFPKEGSTDEYYWLVKWEDVRAVEVVG